MSLRVDDPRIRAAADELLRLVDVGDRWRSRALKAACRGLTTRRSDAKMREVDALLVEQEHKLAALRRTIAREQRMSAAR